MHLLVLVGIALLVFGPKKLPELGKGLGDAFRGFKRATSDEKTRPNIRIERLNDYWNNVVVVRRFGVKPEKDGGDVRECWARHETIRGNSLNPHANGSRFARA